MNFFKGTSDSCIRSMEVSSASMSAWVTTGMRYFSMSSGRLASWLPRLNKVFWMCLSSVFRDRSPVGVGKQSDETVQFVTVP